MIKQSLTEMGQAAKKAAYTMAKASTKDKNQALEMIASLLEKEKSAIQKANDIDIEQGLKQGLNEAMIDRLSLRNRIEGLIQDIRQVIRLPDPIGEKFDEKVLPNHLQVAKYRTPIGVLGVIYESRPNVTIDISALTIKTGNCAILRGGSETLHTNKLLVELIQEALAMAHLPKDVIQLVTNPDRQQVKELLKLNQYIDLIIPRGGAGLHQFCRENSTIPVITGGIGICHMYIDATADLNRAIPVIVNAKTQRPTVCNALDTLLVNEKVASKFIPAVIENLKNHGVQFKLDPIAWNLIEQSNSSIQQASALDWDTEWLSLVLGIKVVKNLDEALEHIRQHSTGHSESILTQTQAHADQFIKEVDSAAVYVNASTRFTDGGQLGLGAEVAISTQKLHARGPMGLQELTTYKWVILGDYHTRKG